MYEDARLLFPQPLKPILEKYAKNTAVILVSDAGAARSSYSQLRLLNTLAFLKALSSYTKQYVWINPLPKRYWFNTTAGELARHTPMFPLDLHNLYRAIELLRGRHHTIERPL